MSARKPKSSSATFFQFHLRRDRRLRRGVFGGAAGARPGGRSVRRRGRPRCRESNVAAPSQQAPASAPAGSDANFPTGLVERLPSSAYPEPVIRGLYGSSLWLDMQGHQWPYYPRIGVGLSGYGWVDTDYKRTRIGDVGQSDHTTKLFGQGRFALRVTPTYSNGTWFAQAQAELIANLNQLDPQPQVADTDDLWVRTGVWKSWDVTVGRFEGFSVYHLGMGLDLNTDERIGAYDNRGAGSVPQPYLASYLYYRPQGPLNIALHLYFGPHLRVELLGQWGNDGTVNALGGRPALIYDLGWLKFRIARGVPVALRAGSRAHLAQRVAGTAAWPAPCSSSSRPGSNSARTSAAPSPTSSRTRPSRTAHSRSTPSKSGDIWSYGGFLNFRPFEGHADRHGRQLRQLHQPAQERQQPARPVDQHAVLPGRPVSGSPPAVREGGRRLRQDALRLQLQQHGRTTTTCSASASA